MVSISRSKFAAIVVLSSLLLGANFVFADHGLTPVGFVNDFAGMLSPGFRQSLEHQLQQFEQQSGNEIAVVTVDSLKGTPIEDFAVTVFQEWRVGKKGKDNGLLLLIVKDDRQMRIEVGYGLEPIITDGRAGRIIRDDLAPAFRDQDYDTGVREAIYSIEQYIRAGQPETSQEVVRTNLQRALPVIFDSGIGFFLAGLFILYFFNFLARSKRIWPGGVVGAALGVFLGWLFISLILGAALFFVFGAFGLFLDYLLSKNYQTRKAQGLPTGFWSSGGGFRGAGFGGFGGGGSGGGGASGSW